MSITRLPEIVFPITQVNKVNEIVDVLNDNLNMYYSAENPDLTSVEGVCTWTVTHNLGTENVTEARLSELFNIINTRIINGKKKGIRTVISTNKELKDLLDKKQCFGTETAVYRVSGYVQTV